MARDYHSGLFNSIITKTPDFGTEVMTYKAKAKFQKTRCLKKEDAPRMWITLDASGKTLGRLASEVSKILRGKHRATFTPHVDCGDGVIILNAEKIHVTGRKEAQKMYYKHSGFIGGLKETDYRTMKARKPAFIIEHAVKGMMPKTRLGRAQMKHLRVLAGDSHKMQAQQPVEINI